MLGYLLLKAGTIFSLSTLFSISVNVLHISMEPLNLVSSSASVFGLLFASLEVVSFDFCPHPAKNEHAIMPIKMTDIIFSVFTFFPPP